MERNSLDLHLNSVKMFSLVAVFLAPLPLIKGKFQYLLDYVRETRYNLILELFFSLYPTTIERKNFLRGQNIIKGSLVTTLQFQATVQFKKRRWRLCKRL